MASNTASTVQLAFDIFKSDDCKKEKAPIIYVHGMFASKDTWGTIPDKIMKFNKRIAYTVDLRNHGASPKSDVSTFDCYVDDLLCFMDSIGAAKAIIVGHSMRGLTAMKLALKAPERVEKLVVEDMSLWDPLLKAAQSLADYGHYRCLDNKDRAQMCLEVLKELPEDKKNSEIEMWTRLAEKMDEDRWTCKSGFGSALNAFKNLKEISNEFAGKYEGPTRFIYGKSSIFPVSIDEVNIRTHFPKVEMVGMKNAGHFIHSYCPKEFEDALRDFLKEE